MSRSWVTPRLSTASSCGSDGSRGTPAYAVSAGVSLPCRRRHRKNPTPPPATATPSTSHHQLASFPPSDSVVAAACSDPESTVVDVVDDVVEVDAVVVGAAVVGAAVVGVAVVGAAVTGGAVVVTDAALAVVGVAGRAVV